MRISSVWIKALVLVAFMAAGRGAPLAQKGPSKPAADRPAKAVETAEERERKQKEKQAENEKKRAEWIEKTVRFGINKDRREAINMILGIRDESLKNSLGDLLIDVIRNETDPEVKARALTVAGDLKNSRAAPAMMEALGDDSEDVQIAAVNSLKNLRHEPARQALAEKLKARDLSADSNLTESLITAMGEFGAEELAGFAKTAIKDVKTTRTIRGSLTMFMGRLGSAAPRDFLVELLKDEDEDRDVRGYAANALARLGAREAAKDIDAVVAIIESYPFKKRKEYYTLYIYCVAAMAKLGDEKAFPRLMEALKSDNSMVRLRAIRLLRDMKEQRTIDILKYKRDYDPSPAVQKAAREALEEMGVRSEEEKTPGAARRPERGEPGPDESSEK
ncbi:MAG TPA: HEAT repeat domain-containing protein [Spirochaetota bacterium]|jgi:HEAT repeat protein|nr:HEAT repeat domain-containing protein [Spirochaetota bacterium]OPZ38751.1 MAG: HEAT repeat protein [Spirochaetes bacterium ADurb.BinA120]HNU92267.1 HEAT repeat domain-containing protein [Spirochaetota bacterium]HPI14764.1 HEAT repeat domain-containing protein [Spirochaetota bacterium]HPO46405.1 HEAT repeat domain-containing protein [Spirochaetota bacterium]